MSTSWRRGRWRRSPRKQNQAGGPSFPSLFSSWFGASQPPQQMHAAEWQTLFPADAAAAPAAVPLDEERTPIPNGMIRAIHLFTDGHANCGETNMDTLAEKASQMLDSATPISVSTLGLVQITTRMRFRSLRFAAASTTSYPTQLPSRVRLAVLSADCFLSSHSRCTSSSRRLLREPSWKRRSILTLRARWSGSPLEACVFA